MIISCFDIKINEATFVVVMIFLSIMTIPFHLEPDTYSNRIKEEIPFGFFDKVLKFPFFYGRLNALTWLYITAFFTIVIGYVGYISLSSSTYYNSFEEVFIKFAVFFMNVNVYCFIAELIRKTFFKETNKQSIVGIFLVMFIISILFSVLGNFMPEDFDKLIVLTNPFGVFFLSKRDGASLFTLGGGFTVFVLAILVNITALKNQLFSYFEHSNEEIPTSLNEMKDYAESDNS